MPLTCITPCKRTPMRLSPFLVVGTVVNSSGYSPFSRASPYKSQVERVSVNRSFACRTTEFSPSLTPNATAYLSGTGKNRTRSPACGSRPLATHHGRVLNERAHPSHKTRYIVFGRAFTLSVTTDSTGLSSVGARARPALSLAIGANSPTGLMRRGTPCPGPHNPTIGIMASFEQRTKHGGPVWNSTTAKRSGVAPAANASSTGDCDARGGQRRGAGAATGGRAGE